MINIIYLFKYDRVKLMWNNVKINNKDMVIGSK